MHTILMRCAAALPVAAALTFGAMTPAHAAPVSSATAAVGKAAPSHVIDVRSWRGHGGWHGGWRHRGWRGGGWGYPFAAGIIAGGIAAGAYPYYYGGPYYYGPPPGPVYVRPAPVYVEPGYGPNGPVRQCWVATDKDRGFGYWRPC